MAPSTCAHVDVRLNELDESALSSLLMTMLPVYPLGTEERGARAAGDEESMEDAVRRPASPSRCSLSVHLPKTLFQSLLYHEESRVWGSVCSCTAVGPQLEHTKEERAELSSGLVTPCDHGVLALAAYKLSTALSR